jgi:hypothetical protein
MPQVKCGICGGNLPKDMICPRKCFDFCNPAIYRLFRYDIDGETIAIFRMFKDDMLSTNNPLLLVIQWSKTDTFEINGVTLGQNTTLLLWKPGSPQTTDFIKNFFVELEL